MTDDLRGVRSDGWKSVEVPTADMGWGTRDAAVRAVADEFKGSSTEVVGLTDVGDLFTPEEKAKAEPDWPSFVFQRLKEKNLIGDADAVLFLRENAIDANGQTYSGFRDYMGIGLIGLIAGAAGKEKQYQPTYMLALNSGVQETMMGASHCMIGFDVQLLDAGGRGVSQEASAVGDYMAPPGMKPDRLEDLTAAERQDLKERCLYALRKGVKDALFSAGLLRKGP